MICHSFIIRTQLLKAFDATPTLIESNQSSLEVVTETTFSFHFHSRPSLSLSLSLSSPSSPLSLFIRFLSMPSSATPMDLFVVCKLLDDFNSSFISYSISILSENEAHHFVKCPTLSRHFHITFEAINSRSSSSDRVVRTHFRPLPSAILFKAYLISFSSEVRPSMVSRRSTHLSSLAFFSYIGLGNILSRS